VIVGEPGLRQRVADTIREVLIAKRDPDKLVADIASMRALMAREHAARSQWDIKQMRGGLIDVEFIAQFLQLRHAAKTPEILSPNTRAALRKAAELGLIDAADGEMLLGALGLWQTVQAIQRLTVEGEFKPDELPIGLRELLARSAGAADFGALEATIVATAERVRAIFDRLLPLPEAAEPAPAAGTT
jgi:glutamate-ammonia-ligase adenylyltransferase